MARESQDIYGDYGSVPTVSPSDAGVGGFSVQANPAAFGSQVGAAVQDVGKESTDLAVHFQGLYNEATARDAVVQGSMKLGDLENEYRQNKGVNAAGAYKDFQTKATALYENMAQSMPTTDAQKLFRDQFTREVGYSVKNAGAWAADQTEKGYATSLQASMENRVNQFATTANDPSQRADLIKGLQGDALQAAQFQGLDSDTANKLVSKSVGQGYEALIKITAQNNPALAQKLYDEATSGSFTIGGKDKDGKPVQVQVPYIDAGSRVQIQSTMQAEFNKQFTEQYQTARDNAMSGLDFDKQAFFQAGTTAGKSQDYLNAQANTLEAKKEHFAQSGKQYDADNQLDQDQGNVLVGMAPMGNYNPDYLKTVYPNDPAKVSAVAGKGTDMQTVAGEVGTFATKSVPDIYKDIEKYKTSDAQSLPQDMKADFVKPYTAKQVQEYRDLATKPSPYDDLFEKAHEAYPGVSVADLKLHAAVESSMDPNADNGKSIGLMQIQKDNLAKLGITDAKDPGQSIMGAAKLMSESGGKDSRTQDLTYYGGSDQKQWGKNTQQYAENLAAVRGTNGNSDQLYPMMKSAADQYAQKFQADPAGTLTQYTPSLQQKLQVGLTSMQKGDYSGINDFVQTSLKQQEALGVDPTLRSALPATTASSIVSGLVANPQGASDVFYQMKQGLGNNYNNVYSSLVTRGKLPPIYQSIANLSENDQADDAKLLGKYISDPDRKGKAVSDLLGTETVSKLKNSIRDDAASKQFISSMIDSGATRDHADGVMKSIDALAQARMLYNHEDMETASTNAVKSFTAGYEYLPNSNARIPTDKFFVVSQNAAFILKHLDEYAALPSTINPKQPGADTRGADYLRDASLNPIWKNSADDSSILLYSHNNKLVMGKNGKPISVPLSPMLMDGVVKERAEDDNKKAALAVTAFSGAF